MKSIAILLLVLFGCASLERDTTAPTPTDAPSDVTEPTPPDATPPPPPPPDANPPDTCEPPKPECECSADCGEEQVCIEGKCHQTCDCDFDCGNHYECHSHVCYNPHGDSPGGD